MSRLVSRLCCLSCAFLLVCHLSPGVVLVAETPGVALTLASPLQVTAARPGDFDGTTRLALNPARYQAIRDHAAGAVRISGFALSDSLQVDLALEAFDVFAPHARVVVGTTDGDMEVGRPNVVLLRGRVVGAEHSSVFLALSPHGTNGWVRTEGESYLISTAGPSVADTGTVVFAESSPAAAAIQTRPWTCGVDQLVAQGLALPPIDKSGLGDDGPAAAQGGAACRVVEIAIETDWEFTGSLFGGNTDASAAYATTLFGALSEIYVRDVNTSVEISFLRVWSDSGDPWNQSTTSNQLNQFRSYWNSLMGSVTRNGVHFLSGRNLGGGVAWVDALCNTPWAYALSANLNGFFPYPLLDHSSQNWDVVVTAHEMGHNFGAPHTHGMSPPIDGCAFGDCSATPNGTIMSYCHTCPGGLSNILLRFHDRIIDEQILSYLNFGAPCNLEVVCGVMATPTVTVEGARYVAITPLPENSNQAVALQVTSSTYPCFSQYVDANGVLADTPTFLTPASWGTVHVRGEGLVPGAVYSIQTEDTAGTFTPSVNATTWRWGDVDNSGVTNLADVLLQVLIFQGDVSIASVEAGDIWPCVPDELTNLNDMQQAVLAFQGGSFEDTQCSVPCE